MSGTGGPLPSARDIVIAPPRPIDPKHRAEVAASAIAAMKARQRDSGHGR